ncbi:MAG: MlaD family protein [Campylobacterales bacterium]|nr:MlaD family protein [Campylobacterales bacterium]
MNNKVNYSLVGSLVLFGVALMLAFIYWLLKPSSEQETKTYAIYFNESILGLNIDAPVKYRGIAVGKVSKLQINAKNSEQVEVLVTILKNTPIKEDTIAKLTAQGITGLSYINLDMGSNEAPELQVKDGEKYPAIKSAPSFFENIESSLGSVSTKLSATLAQTEKLLNEENQKQITLVLQRTAGFMDKMEKLLDEESVNHLHSSAKNIDQVSKEFTKIAPNVDKLIDKSGKWEESTSSSLSSIMESYKGIKSAMDEVKRAVSSGEFNLKEISSDVVPTMNNTLLEMQGLMIKIEDTLHAYERSPGDILFKQEETKKGPGEK